jgi:hypothetical protein
MSLVSVAIVSGVRGGLKQGKIGREGRAKRFLGQNVAKNEAESKLDLFSNLEKPDMLVGVGGGRRRRIQ